MYPRCCALGRAEWRAQVARFVRCPAVAAGGISPASTAAHAVKIRFNIPYRVHFGQSLSIVGSTDVLGEWDVSTRVPMEWSDGDVWQATVIADAIRDALEYKYVVVNDDGCVAHWKPGSNFELDVSGVQGTVVVEDAWDGTFHKVSAFADTPDVQESSNGTASSVAPGVAPAMSDGDAALRAALEEAFDELESTLDISLQLLKDTDPADPRLLVNDQKLAAVHRRACSLARAIEAGAAPPAYILKEIQEQAQGDIASEDSPPT